jgi:hypothetical protein
MNKKSKSTEFSVKREISVRPLSLLKGLVVSLIFAAESVIAGSVIYECRVSQHYIQDNGGDLRPFAVLLPIATMGF